MKFKKVSEDEFTSFLINYPNELEVDVALMFEPPRKTYNDFSDGKVWPDSIVASVSLLEDGSEEGYKILKEDE